MAAKLNAIFLCGGNLERHIKPFRYRKELSDERSLSVVDSKPHNASRIEALDLARGVAVSLMILSHGIKGLLDFDQFPEWGLVPIHLITKFSSTLFVLVFGISLAMFHLPHSGSLAWPARRKRLWIRALTILFWYKALTIVEMFHLYSREDILSTLKYQAFPVYVEILGFYAVALIWLPLLLPLLKRTPVVIQFLIAAGMGSLSYYLYENFDFWGIETLKALLVEHEQHYCWGQISRGSIAIAGIALGGIIHRFTGQRSLKSGLVLFGLSTLSFIGFFFYSHETFPEKWISLALNEGKHPPDIDFLLFSSGGAFLILALSFWGGSKLARALSPITLIGKDALQAFIFHIVVLFVFYRYLFDYWHKISYDRAFVLTIALLFLTAAWIRVIHWLRKEKS